MKAELFQPPMGNDLSVVNAARVSFAKASDWVVETDDNGNCYNTLSEADVNLIKYLARGCSTKEWKKLIAEIMLCQDTESISETVTNLMRMAQHWVPFTHTAISLRMGAPYPIRTQAFKHKVGFTESEESRRYITSTPTLYMPDYFAAAADNVKQGSTGKPHYNSGRWLEEYTNHAQAGIKLYETMLEDGVAPEEARFVLPLGCEVHWIWTGNLASFARYYNQRTDAHAQRQGKQLALEVERIIHPLFPVSWRALTDYY